MNFLDPTTTLPKARSDIKLIDFGDEKVLYDKHMGKVHVLNRVGLAIWSACDGVQKVGPLLEQLERDFTGVSREILSNDVANYIASLHQKNLFDPH